MHLTAIVFVASALVAMGAAQQLPRTAPMSILKQRINRQIDNAAYSYGYEQQYDGVHRVHVHAAPPVASLVYQQPQARQYYQPQPISYSG